MRHGAATRAYFFFSKTRGKLIPLMLVATKSPLGSIANLAYTERSLWETQETKPLASGLP